MSGSTPNSESPIDIRTLDRSEVALAFRRRLLADTDDGTKQLDTPTKALPARELFDDDQVSEDVQGANELYAQLTSGKLEKIRRNGDATHLQSLEKQDSRFGNDEFNFAFLEYDESHRITKIEAYQMAGVLAQYSDFLTTPRQKHLFSGIDPENGLEDRWYKRLRHGTELFLQACHDHDDHLPIMGAIPPLDRIYVEDLIELYENYGVFAFYIDFDWDAHPTKPNQIARMQYLIRRIRNQRVHDDVLFYALNARRGQHAKELGFTPAADIASATMGIDIIGCNHASPDWPKEVFEHIERNQDFPVYRSEIMGYIQSPLERLEENIPEMTTLNVPKLISRASGSDNARRRCRKVLNSELQGFDLAELREALEDNATADYLEERHIADELLDAGNAVRKAFKEGAQAKLGEFT